MGRLVLRLEDLARRLAELLLVLTVDGLMHRSSGGVAAVYRSIIKRFYWLGNSMRVGLQVTVDVFSARTRG